MKLIDLTKKKLVHKATVAAAKAPRLELGVLGISIGQQQSIGDTSKPAMKWMNESLNESVEVTAEDLIEVLEFLGSNQARSRITKLMGGDDLPEGFDINSLVKDVIRSYTHEMTGDAAAEASSHYMNIMWHLTNMQSNLNSGAEKMEELLVKLKELDQSHVVSERVLDAVNAVKRLSVDVNFIRVYKDMFSRIGLQLDNVMRAAHGMEVYGREMEPAQVKIAQAYLKIHGIPMKKVEG